MTADTQQRCRSCGAPIVWTFTPSGKRAPIDADEDLEGTVALLAGDSLPAPVSVFLTNDALSHARSAGLPLRTSHFATCPNADQHRKRS